MSGGSTPSVGSRLQEARRSLRQAAADGGPEQRPWLKDGGPERPWLKTKPGDVDREQIRQWRKDLDAQHHEALADGDTAADTALEPGISVVVPSHRGREHVGTCLRSLARQTLDHAMFEVIVVLNGPPDGSRQVVEEIRAANPTMTLRVVTLTTAGASRARNAGIAAAVREYTTFVDDDDFVSPAFLEVLLAHAGPRVVPVAPVVDVGPEGENHDNYINGPLREHAGKLVLASELPVATSFNTAKAVSTRLIKSIPYDIALRSGEDLVFWTTIMVRGKVAFYACAPEEGATYHRLLRPGSLSRAELGFDFNVTQRLEAIARLERLLDETDVSSRQLVISKVRSQSQLIGRYVEHHPDEHARVVEEIDRHPVFHLPYRQINKPLPRGLVIAFAFPPYADTSAVVMAKRVRTSGRVVDVIYNAMDRIRERDETLTRISGPFVGAERALETPSWFADWRSMEAFAVEGLQTIERWTSARGPYSWLYSRAHFAASHFLAAAHKLANPDVTWRAEFSDPLSRDIMDAERGTPITPSPFVDQLRDGMAKLGLPVPDSMNCFQWCEEITYALADELVFTNENQMEYMLGYCSNADVAELARKKAVISPHPTLPESFYSMVEHHYPLEEGVAHLAYFGNFYATRGLDDVLRAIAGRDSWTRERIRLHVFTTKPEELQRRAAELGISGSVRVGPYVGYLAFLNLTTKFDCLIVNDAVTGDSHPRNPYLPSKWSDYKGSGSPVWGLVEAGSPLSAQPLHHRSPVGDVEAAGEVLTRIVETVVGQRPLEAELV